ncbi:MAG: hypothetical protein A2W31_08495 [Planctomycetes bacterium RBG_16_64_10]|nr:MAG: hypothetical protein A2W31_08495 [Planctomycetes bacterium RBG_16_64_10]
MLERSRSRRRETADPRPGNHDDLYGACNTDAMVTVCHGLHGEAAPVGNMTVAEIRARYADRFDIDPASDAFIDNQIVRDDTVVRPGQLLMFASRVGAKG